MCAALPGRLLKRNLDMTWHDMYVTFEWHSNVREWVDLLSPKNVRGSSPKRTINGRRVSITFIVDVRKTRESFSIPPSSSLFFDVRLCSAHYISWKKSRTPALSSTKFRSMLIFASSVTPPTHHIRHSHCPCSHASWNRALWLRTKRQWVMHDAQLATKNKTKCAGQHTRQFAFK